MNFAMYVLVASIMLSGCGGVVRSTSTRYVPPQKENGAKDPNPQEAITPQSKRGMLYFLPKAMLRLKIQPVQPGGTTETQQTPATTNTVVNIYNNTTQSSDNKDKVAGAPFISFTATDNDNKKTAISLDMFYTIDPKFAYSLQYVANSASDDEINFIIKDNLLSEISSSTEDKTPEIAKQGVEIIKQAALAFSGVGTPAVKTKSFDRQPDIPEETGESLLPEALEVDIDPMELIGAKQIAWCTAVETHFTEKKTSLLNRLTQQNSEVNRQNQQNLKALKLIQSKYDEDVLISRRNYADNHAKMISVKTELEKLENEYSIDCKQQSEQNTDQCGNLKTKIETLNSENDILSNNEKQFADIVENASANYAKYKKSIIDFKNSAIASGATRKTLDFEKELLEIKVQDTDPSKSSGHSFPNPPSALLVDIAKHKVALCIDRMLPPEGSPPAEPTPPTDGVYYRAAFPYRLTLLAWQGDQIVRKIERIVMLPNESPAYLYDMKRASLAKKTYDLKFENGFLTSAKLTKTSELLAVVSLPADLLKGIASIPAELIQLKINYNSQQQALLDAQKAQFDSLKAFNQSILQMYQDNTAQLKAVMESRH